MRAPARDMLAHEAGFAEAVDPRRQARPWALSKSRAFARALRPASRPLCPEDLRDFPSPAINRARVTPVGGQGDLYGRNAAAFQSASSLAVLWPERFRGGCAFGAGFARPGLSRGDQRLRPCLEWRARKSMRQASPHRIVSASWGQPRRRPPPAGPPPSPTSIAKSWAAAGGTTMPSSTRMKVPWVEPAGIETDVRRDVVGKDRRAALHDESQGNVEAARAAGYAEERPPLDADLHERRPVRLAVAFAGDLPEGDLAAQGGSLADAPARIGLERGAAIDDLDFRAEDILRRPRRPAAAADRP